MLKSKLGLLAVAAAFVCALVWLSVTDPVRPVKPARAFAEAPGSADSGKPSAPTEPMTRPAVSRADPAGLTPKREEKILAWLKQARPGYYQRLMDLKEKSPYQYSRIMPSMEGVMRRQVQMSPPVRRATNGEREKQMVVSEIFRRMRQSASESEKAELKTELKKAIADHFEAEQALREQRLNELEAQIKQLRQELERTRKERDEIIAGRLARWLKAAKPIAAKAPPAK